MIPPSEATSGLFSLLLQQSIRSTDSFVGDWKQKAKVFLEICGGFILLWTHHQDPVVYWFFFVPGSRSPLMGSRWVHLCWSSSPGCNQVRLYIIRLHFLPLLVSSSGESTPSLGFLGECSFIEIYFCWSLYSLLLHLLWVTSINFWVSALLFFSFSWHQWVAARRGLLTATFEIPRGNFVLASFFFKVLCSFILQIFVFCFRETQAWVESILVYKWRHFKK